MPKMRHSPADREQFWRDTITTWKESGQSIRAFCASRGIAEATFFVKRRELARRGPGGRTRNRQPRRAARPSPPSA